MEVVGLTSQVINATRSLKRHSTCRFAQLKGRMTQCSGKRLEDSPEFL